MRAASTSSIRAWRPWLRALTALLLMLPASALARDRQPRNAEDCFFDLHTLAVVRSTEAIGEDLAVTVQWSRAPSLPAVAEVRALDSLGQIVGAQIVTTIAGQRMTIKLTGALTGAPVTGFQFQVEIHEPGVGPLAAVHYFRVVIDCPPGMGCVFRTVDGVRGGAVVTSVTLMRLLDGLEEAGSSDLLGDALMIAPELKGEIFTLAEELSDLDRQVSLDGCRCRWDGATDTTGEERRDLDDQGGQPQGAGHPDWEIGGESGPGAGYVAGAQMVDDGPLMIELGGDSELILKLTCWRILGWTSENLDMDLPGNEQMEIRFPQASPCEPGCDAKIRNQTELWGRLEVEAYGNLFNGAAAEADSDALYHLLTRNLAYPIFSATRSVDVKALDQGAGTDLVCTHKSADQTLAEGWVKSVLHTTSTAQINAANESYALAMSEAYYWMEAVGEASCAVIPTDFVELSFENYLQDDGLAIERWGPGG